MRFPQKIEFSCPVKITSGKRALEHLPYELGALNACKPLLLNDEDAFRENRTRVLVDALRESDVVLGVVETLPQAVDLDLVHQLAAFYRDRDHDALIIMGAGPLADLAKLVNLVVSTGQPDPNIFAGEAGIEQRLKPMVLIAPAAATGYEASGRVLTGPVGLRSNRLMPDLVVIDERTLGIAGRDAIIESGLAALAFGAEAILDPDENPMVDIYAANAVQMAVTAFEMVVQQPEAIEPRLLAASAAVMAGCTMAGKPPGFLHRLGRHLADTGRVSIPGAMGILLPATVSYGARHWGWIPADLLTSLVGLERSASTPDRQRPMRVVATLMALINDLFNHTEGRMPRTLGDAGFKSQDLAPIVESFMDISNGADQDAVQAILRCALDGEPVPSDR